MPEKKSQRAASKDKKGRQVTEYPAGENVPEEIEHIRKGKHGALPIKQAIAIGRPRRGVPG